VAADRATTAATGSLQAIVVPLASGERGAIALGVENAGRPVTVFLPDGTAVGAPAERTPAVRLAQTGRSLSTQTDDGREILVAVGRADGTYVARTVVTDAELARGVTQAWAVLAGLGLLLVLLGLVVADRLAQSLIAPMRELSGVSHRLAAGDLSARASVGGPPEVRDVGAALNHLAGRIRELLDQERETVADLSHRLRTPLTALRLEAEALRDPAEASRVTARVDDLQRTVTLVIQSARNRTGGRADCDAAAVVRERVAFWSALAEDTDRRITVDVPVGPLSVGLPADELAAAVDALLGNVFAHTPDGTAFAVGLVARDGGGAVLTVADAGAGLPPGLSARGASGAGSTGLGLDIVRRAASAAGGGLVLGTAPSGGARVTVELGPPA
jgi:signal transduction histidine kinase